MTPHIASAVLLAYIDGEARVDPLAIATHLAECDICCRHLADLEARIYLLRDAAVHDFLAGREPNSERDLGWLDLEERRMMLRAEQLRADTFFAELALLPIAEWSAAFARWPRERTESMVRRIMKAVEVALDRNAVEALQMVEAAETITQALDALPARRCLGDCWKHRANALRHLGQYPESLDAAEIAEAFYRSIPLDDFNVGQALYTRAGTLFKMTRFADALAVLGQAAEILRPFGPTVPFAKTLMLDAGIHHEQGEIARAEEIWLEVVPMLESLGDTIEFARVRANLAECALKLGRTTEALGQAEVARARYLALGMDAEAIRTDWTIAMVRLVLGERDAALDGLYTAAAAFEERNMLLDAAFVKLDITEELLQRWEWNAAAITARDLAILFTKAGVTLASVLALSYLGEAVAGERATPALVQYVRAYVMTDDGERPFAPPADHAN